MGRWMEGFARQVIWNSYTNGGSETMETTQLGALEYNTQLATLLKKGLKENTGARSVRQNYRGKGKQSQRRQLYVNWPSGAVIDLWLDDGFVQLGGVVWIRNDGRGVRPNPQEIQWEGRSPEELYPEIEKALLAWGIRK